MKQPGSYIFTKIEDPPSYRRTPKKTQTQSKTPQKDNVILNSLTSTTKISKCKLSQSDHDNEITITINLILKI